MEPRKLYCPACVRELTGGLEACPTCGGELTSLPGEISLGGLLDGKYRIERLIDEGGMGAVFLGTQESLGRPVAVKVLRPAFSEDRVLTKRFFAEGRILAQLRHPNTIRVFEQGQTPGGLLYIVMELLTGRTLRDVLVREGVMPLDRMVHIGIQVCRSLEEAHAKGLVHRDLKPEHVFLEDHAGEPDFVRVFDFGIAKRLDVDETVTRVTQPGTAFGTVTYMSPEQANADEVDARTDVYSLGIVFHEMLTGDPIFHAEKQLQCLMRKLSYQPQMIASRHPDVKVPHALDELICRMLALRPEERPSGVAEVREVLEGLMSVRVLVPPSEAPGPQKATAQARAILTAATALHGRPITFGLAECVGRQREKDQLIDFVEGYVRGREGQVLLLEGATGVGKSRLIDWLAEGYRDSQHLRFVRSSFAKINTVVSLQAVKDAVRALLELGDQPQAASAALSSKFSTGLSKWDIEDRQLAAILMDLVFPGVSRGTPLPEVSPERYWETAFSALLTLFGTIASKTPLVLVLDDAQWADARSLEFLQQFLGTMRSGAMPVAVILVVNAEEAEERKDFTSLVMWILRHLKALCQRISLQPLAGSEFCEFVGRLAPLDDPSRDAVFRLSQGNPFFTQEVLQFLYDEGVLVQDGSRYVITRDVSQLPDVPLSLREMVTRKLERLKEKSPLARDCRAVLEHLALFGERMPLRLLQDALERQGRDELKARLDEIVEELCEHRLTRVESRRNQDFLEPYHAIISYALSVEMGHGLRGRRIHGIFADLLEAGEARKEPLVLERIAHHCRLAGDRGRGMRFYYEAGLEWERRFDLLRARTCFEEWLALDAVEPGEVEAALDARYHLAQVVLLDGQVDLAEQHFRHILESADPATGTVFFGRALVGLGDILPEDSDLREALQQLRQAAAYFRRHGQRVDLARAVERQGGLAAQGGRLAVADLLYGAAERMYSEAQARAELASLYNRRGLLAIQRAGVKEATELFERGLAIQDELNNPVECARAYNNIAMALMQQGAAGEAEKVLRKALQRLEALRHPWGLATVRLNLAIALVMQRDFYSGRDVLEQALQTARSVFSRRIIARILANQATVEAELGNPRRAVRLAHESLEIREELKVPLEVASALAIVGDVHGRAGEPDLARDYLRQAVVVFERAGLQNSLVAETYQRLAELEHHSGDRKAARTWHDKARRISEVLGRAPGSLPSDPELDPPPPRDPEPPKDAPPRLKSGRPSSALVFAPAAASGISL